MNEVVWGIIGCGNVTEVKSGPAFNLAKNSSLLAVMRRDKAKAKDYATRHKVPEYYDHADSIINHPKINAIYIATPPSTHLHYALLALAANKNAYIEKPMTLNSKEAFVLKKALEKSTSKLTVAHYRRQVPMFLEVKRLIEDKAIGDVKTVEITMFQSGKADLVANSESNWRIDPTISGGGYFNDLAPHQIDLMLYWFGCVKTFSGQSSIDEAMSNVASKITGIINFENGITCKGHWDFMANETEEYEACCISGTEGSIKFPFFGNEISIQSNGNNAIIPFEHPKHIQQPLIQSTVNYFLDKQDNPCSIEDGVLGMQIIDSFIG